MTPATNAYLDATTALVEGSAGTRTIALPEQIAATLRERIQFGEIKAGDAIREIPLASEFGVSRGPVRDALKLLEQERLIVIGRRTGATVRELTGDALVSMFRVRAELSGLGMRLAADAPTRPPEVLDALTAGAKLLRALAEDPAASASDYIQVRRRVSELIHRLSGSHYLGRLILETEREIPVHWAAILPKSRQKRSSAAWMRIVRAIRSRDAPRAEMEGRDIVLASLEELRRAGDVR